MAAVKFIASTALPEVELTVAMKRVRERLRYHKKIQPLASNDVVLYPDFWLWAGESWPILQTVVGYPNRPPKLVSEVAGSTGRATDELFEFVIPVDLSRAQGELRKCHEQICQLINELNETRHKAQTCREALTNALIERDELKARLDAQDARTRERSRKSSAAGKQAAGIPKHRS